MGMMVREDGDDRFVCEEVEQNGSIVKKKRKREVSAGLGKKAWAFIGNQLGKLREEWRLGWNSVRRAEREQERQRSESFRMECEQEREWKWEEWEDDRRRSNLRRGWMIWGHHRAEMGQMQTRILHEQQNLTSQLLGIVSQWTAHPGGLSDHTSASNHYLSQMMQNLHHVNSLDHDDARVDGENQDDQFIVDG
ncbi:hypothetical protein M0R45_020290 [Rubus argutus]|uniref:Uncharacterized protein n=1 Tax=Rubus argutus TaxID=59490 RepID=A0AAW1X9A7_RUBAR